MSNSIIDLTAKTIYAHIINKGITITISPKKIIDIICMSHQDVAEALYRKILLRAAVIEINRIIFPIEISFFLLFSDISEFISFIYEAYTISL